VRGRPIHGDEATRRIDVIEDDYKVGNDEAPHDLEHRVDHIERDELPATCVAL